MSILSLGFFIYSQLGLHGNLTQVIIYLVKYSSSTFDILNILYKHTVYFRRPGNDGAQIGEELFVISPKFDLLAGGQWALIGRILEIGVLSF